ncbi:hypothetical protein [Amycolatopsis sp. FDAARGOS 1241]|uniref:hypothetical protein n=1 Tax=Amycolatopsis sp. FDAARGOS 1241 TaxID=2778070 RepID=UPI00194E3E73|nr:hypothetical protein [Amycolatopsis sp. FDAARGOS 1241]QRP47684.1 hypothetical protein I6J71_07085 [Amycolatopsis sp. FDAARGOS 1241]
MLSSRRGDHSDDAARYQRSAVSVDEVVHGGAPAAAATVDRVVRRLVVLDTAGTSATPARIDAGNTHWASERI